MNKDNKTTTINGQVYDMVTGMPVAPSKGSAPTKQPEAKRNASNSNARQVHGQTQRSSTLRRSPARKPASKAANQAPANAIQPKKSRPTVAMDIAKSPKIKKFGGTKPAGAPASAVAAKSTDLAPTKHPHELKANQKINQKKQAAAPTKHTPSKEIKEAEIKKALDSAKSEKKPKRTRKSSAKRKKTTRITLIAVSLIAVIAIVIWINLPPIWVRVAASQTGVEATFPHFRPDGYSLKLPIETSNNQVKMTFVSNQNDTSFTLVQEKSQMDSQAVRSMVEGLSDGQFLTVEDSGLTIFTFDGNAAWVNKGVLYSLAGDAPLPRDTIANIAKSL